MDIEEVSETLAGEEAMLNNALKWACKSRTGLGPLYSPFGLRWQEDNGYEAAPHTLEISGVGCSKFRETLPILRQRSRPVGYFSRLDFAYEVVFSKSWWRYIVKDAIERTFSPEYEEKKYKQYRFTGAGDAITIYIGSRKGSKFFRIYNKSLQDSSYQYRNPETGEVQKLDDDEYIIRYEVELKRHKVTSGNSVRLYDPTPMFDAYYSECAEERKKLIQQVITLWCDYADEKLLPGFVEDVESFVIEENAHFVKKPYSVYDMRRATETVQNHLFVRPSTWDRTAQYVVGKYGKYIPIIMADTAWNETCWRMSEEQLGYTPEMMLQEVDNASIENRRQGTQERNEQSGESV